MVFVHFSILFYTTQELNVKLLGCKYMYISIWLYNCCPYTRTCVYMCVCSVYSEHDAAIITSSDWTHYSVAVKFRSGLQMFCDARSRLTFYANVSQLCQCETESIIHKYWETDCERNKTDHPPIHKHIHVRGNLFKTVDTMFPTSQLAIGLIVVIVNYPRYVSKFVRVGVVVESDMCNKSFWKDPRPDHFDDWWQTRN